MNRKMNRKKYIITASMVYIVGFSIYNILIMKRTISSIPWSLGISHLIILMVVSAMFYKNSNKEK